MLLPSPTGMVVVAVVVVEVRWWPGDRAWPLAVTLPFTTTTTPSSPEGGEKTVSGGVGRGGGCLLYTVRCNETKEKEVAKLPKFVAVPVKSHTTFPSSQHISEQPQLETLIVVIQTTILRGCHRRGAPGGGDGRHPDSPAAFCVVVEDLAGLTATLAGLTGADW